MIIKCPKCNAGIDNIAMTSNMFFVSVNYCEETDKFKVDTPQSSAVEEVSCDCLVCGHYWDWVAYKRNILEGDE